MNGRKFYYGCLILTFVLWGGLYVAAKYALHAIPPITVLMLRYLIAAALLGAMVLKKGFQRIEKGDGIYFWLIGGTGYFLSIALQLYGTGRLDASMASLIYALNPVITSLLSFLFLKERVSALRIMGIALSLTGVCIILGRGSGVPDIGGILAMLGATFLWSVSSVITHRISNKYDSVEITFLGMAAALVFAIPASVFELYHMPADGNFGAAAAVLYMAIFGTVAAYILWNMSLKGLSASTCAMLFPIQPLTSAIIGALLLHEQITAAFAAGAGFIFAGILLSAGERTCVKEKVRKAGTKEEKREGI